MAIESVALLGTGTMGAGMAANLLKAGFRLTVYNRTAAKAAPLAAMGATIAETPAKAVADTELVISILADDAVSRDAWMGVDGALAAARSGAVLVECGTMTPAWIAELAAAARSRGLDLLDAPVTGSRVQAESGQLIFLVGGDEAAFNQVKPALEAMSKQIVHLGPVGSGATMKLINNFLSGVQVASLAEAIAWLERTGLDRDKALEILKAGAPGSPLLAGISARMTKKDYAVNFLLRLMAKDLAYAQRTAAGTGVELATAAAAHQVFVEAAEAGYGESDMSSIVELLRGKPRPKG